MSKFKNLVIFIILPIIVIVLLILNAKISSKKFILQSEIQKNEYNAQIECNVTKLNLKPSEEKIIKVNVKNNGTMVWTPAEKNGVDLSYHILNNNKAINEGQRASLPGNVETGQEVSLDLKVKAPNQPGKYNLELDMVQENVTWFKEKGSKTFSVQFDVE